MLKKSSYAVLAIGLILISTAFYVPEKADTVKPWSRHLTLTYKYTETSGFVKTIITVKKDSVIYENMEPGKEMTRRLLLDTASQQKITKLMDDYKFLSLNKKSDQQVSGNSYTYTMDKFRKVIVEPKSKRRFSKFDNFNKEFLAVVLVVIFKNEVKESWH